MTIEIGQKIERWTVLEKLSKNGRIYYRCQCECGTIKEVRSDHLKAGKSRSCGCLQKEVVSNNYDDLTNCQFGDWTVIEKTDRPTTSNQRGTYWLCRCRCGAEKIVSGHTLKNGTSQSCGCVKSRGENKIAKILTENNITFGKQFNIKDCKSKRNSYCYFDFIVYREDNSYVLIEYNGKQHYTDDNWNWESPKENDQIKKQYCKDNDIELIIIPYWDYEKIDWNYLKERCKL